MKHFVQLKDGIVFAYHQSSTEQDLPGDNIIEVSESGANFLEKKYDNGVFIDAPLIRYAILDSNNIVIGIGNTVYSSDIPENAKECDNDVDIRWSWSENGFTEPSFILPLQESEPQTEDNLQSLEEEVQPE